MQSELEKAVQEILGDSATVSVGRSGWEQKEFLEITFSDNLTFQALEKLSSLLQTEKIDIVQGSEGYYYSAMTYDTGTLATLHVYDYLWP